MNCPKCSAYNEQGNVFCVSCGDTLVWTANLPPTMMAGQSPGPTATLPAGSVPPNSEATVIHPNLIPPQTFGQPQPGFSVTPDYGQSQAGFQPNAFGQSQAGFQGVPNFQQSFPVMQPQAEPRANRTGLWIAIAAIVVILGCGAIGTAVYFLRTPSKPAEKLPDHLGLFIRSGDALSELKKRDYTSIGAARDAFVKEDSMPSFGPKPETLLYTDGKDIVLGDLKIVPIDSIKNDGTLKAIDYKVSPVEGKPDIKRIWVDQSLANGKYAFMVVDGYFDDGKHRFWPFQIKDSDRGDNGDLAKSISVGLKSKSKTKDETDDGDVDDTPTPKPTQTQTPTPKRTEPPVGSTVAVVRINNVVLRSGPSQATAKIGSLGAGQKVYVLQYSGRYETFITRDGRELYSNYAYVQTESGRKGWVYAAFLQ